MAEEQRTDKASGALYEGAAGCPRGHVAMMMSSQIVPFVFDATQPAPDFLVEQSTSGNGFKAERCWQYHLVLAMDEALDLLCKGTGNLRWFLALSGLLNR